MSTVQRAASGSDEFPVLLRLPDLNAPRWSAAPASIEAALPVAAPAASSAAEPAAVSTETVAAATSTDASTTSQSLVATATAFLERAWQGEFTNFPQWSLVRQITTGGVLVGGLALAFWMFSGDKQSPDASPTANQPVKPSENTPRSAIAVTPLTPSNQRDETSPAGTHIAKIAPPPAFGEDWNTSPAPSLEHRDAGNRLPDNALDVRTPPTPRTNIDPPLDVTQRRDERGSEPNRSAVSVSVAAYPTTDPRTFIYRPATAADAPRDRADIARRLDSIAPPPRR